MGDPMLPGPACILVFLAVLGRLAREKIAAWVDDYNTRRPHSSLGYATPAAFAAELKKQGAASLRIAGAYATQPLASTAHTRNNDERTLIAAG